MDKKLNVTWTAYREEREYSLTLPYQAPYGESYDVIYEFLMELVTMAQEHSKTMAPQKQGESDVISQ